MRAARLLSPAALAVALLAGCGSSGTSNASSAIQPAPSGSQTGAAPGAVAAPTTPATPPVPAAIAKKPTIAKPSGPAPKALVIRDLVKGSGPAAKAGQMLTVQYVGVLYNTGKQFQASWDGAGPFTFPVGTGQVIPGWDKGLIGMHVGGRRQLIIPAALAYKSVARPGIPPNSPLVFDVDLLAAR